MNFVLIFLTFVFFINFQIRKPLMERKRRERINNSLSELASLLTEARLVKQEQGKTPKLEKADILELTVKHLHCLKHKDLDITTIQTEETNKKVNSSGESGYKEGFTKCMGVVEEALSSTESKNLKERLINHLSSCLKSLPAPNTNDDSDKLCNEHNLPPTPVSSPERISSPDIHDESSQSNSSKEENTAQLTLIPAKLPDGGVAFLLQGDASILLSHEETQSSNSSSSTSSSNASPTDFNEFLIIHTWTKRKLDDGIISIISV